MVDGTALWFGAAGFEVLNVVNDRVELVIDVEMTSGPVGWFRRTGQCALFVALKPS